MRAHPTSYVPQVSSPNQKVYLLLYSTPFVALGFAKGKSGQVNHTPGKVVRKPGHTSAQAWITTFANMCPRLIGLHVVLGSNHAIAALLGMRN